MATMDRVGTVRPSAGTTGGANAVRLPLAAASRTPATIAAGRLAIWPSARSASRYAMRAPPTINGAASRLVKTRVTNGSTAPANIPITIGAGIQRAKARGEPEPAEDRHDDAREDRRPRQLGKREPASLGREQDDREHVPGQHQWLPVAKGEPCAEQPGHRVQRHDPPDELPLGQLQGGSGANDDREHTHRHDDGRDRRACRMEPIVLAGLSHQIATIDHLTSSQGFNLRWPAAWPAIVDLLTEAVSSVEVLGVQPATIHPPREADAHGCWRRSAPCHSF